jgi:hypothetical protein
VVDRDDEDDDLEGAGEGARGLGGDERGGALTGDGGRRDDRAWA